MNTLLVPKYIWGVILQNKATCLKNHIFLLDFLFLVYYFVYGRFYPSLMKFIYFIRKYVRV